MKKKYCLFCRKELNFPSMLFTEKKYCSKRCRNLAYKKRNHEQIMQKLHKYRKLFYTKQLMNKQSKEYQRKNCVHKSKKLNEGLCPKCGRFGYFVQGWKHNNKTGHDSGYRIDCFHKQKSLYDICKITNKKGVF